MKRLPQFTHNLISNRGVSNCQLMVFQMSYEMPVVEPVPGSPKTEVLIPTQGKEGHRKNFLPVNFALSLAMALSLRIDCEPKKFN